MYKEMAIRAYTTTHLCMMDCSMDAKGVTPMPVATRTACSAAKMALDGAPCGPSTRTSSGGRERECLVEGRTPVGGRDSEER